MHVATDKSMQKKVIKETLIDKFMQKKIFGKRLHPLCALVIFYNPLCPLKTIRLISVSCASSNKRDEIFFQGCRK